jgi:uncharacterized surface anchored protein
VTLPTTGLRPGDYQLVVGEAAAGGTVDRGSLPFSIRGDVATGGAGPTGR